MYRDISKYIERLIEFSTKGAFLKEMEKAKNEFFHPDAHVFEDDRVFERRMALFFDWYVFDRKLKDGKTPLTLYIDEHASKMSPEDNAAFQGFLKYNHSLFEVLSNTKKIIIVKDLFTKKRHSIHEEENPLFFQKRLLLEARIIPLKDKEYFSGAFCFHPPEVKKLLSKELKKLRKSKIKDTWPLLRKFFLIAIRWERYRHVDPYRIYSDTLKEYADKPIEEVTGNG